ncbi:MAG: ABC transporter permease [Bacteroidales bacterium]
MVRSYIKYAFRNLIKQKGHTLINLVGLSFSMAIIILIYLYVSRELRVDSLQEKGDRIYWVSSSVQSRDGELFTSSYTLPPMAEAFREKVPGVEAACRLRLTPAFIGPGKEVFQERIGFVDSSFFDLFGYEFLAGDRVHPLRDPKSVVLTEDVARKLFRDSLSTLDDAIGRSIRFPEPEPGHLYTVTAVIADEPDLSSLYFTVLVPYENARSYSESNNYGGNTYTYVLLDENNDLEGIRRNGQTLVEEFYGEGIALYVQMGYLSEEHEFTLHFNRFTESYLNPPDIYGSYSRQGNKTSLYILSTIGILLLLIACFNYVMISIGTALNRLRDFGMMNVVGARRWQVLAQFVVESFVLTLLSLFLGIVLAEQLLPLFNKLAGEDLRFALYAHPGNYLFLAALLSFIVISTSAYVGGYLLRRSQALELLKKERLSVRRNGVARFSVVLQFFIAIVLLISGGVIMRQLSYMVHRDVGFNKEHTVVLHVDFDEQRIGLLKEKIVASPAVAGVTVSDRNFSSGSSSRSVRTEKGEIVDVRLLRVDKDYVPTLGLELIQGRNFKPGETAVDSIPRVIVNEKLIAQLGLKDPVGRIVDMDGGGDGFQVEIIGVVRDFHFDSMHDEIQGLMLYTANMNGLWHMFVRPVDGRTAEVLSHCEASWKEVVPEFNWEYRFLSDILEEQYKGEDRWSRIIAYAAVIAILLSCLGLMGISSLLVARRFKEIGIRKVNGATVPQILVLLNANMLKWIVLSYLLACPVAWFAMHKWLENFAFRISLSWWIFALAGVAAFLISIFTVTLQIVRVARQNPVRSLRYE